MALRNLRRHQGVKRLDDEPWVVLRRVAISATLADDPSGEHPFRVAELARRIALHVGLPQDEVQAIERGALLHDLGKCTLPARAVWRRGESEAEYERMRRSHADAGAELIVLGEVPDFEVARDIARHHHERWDGTGFPDQLAGAGIPLAARIVAVADRFDVLTEPRFGAPARSSTEAVDAIRAASGREFAPKMVEALEAVVARLPADAGQRRAELAAGAFRSADWRAVMALGRLGVERAKRGL